jgi:hypothetical protein
MGTPTDTATNRRARRAPPRSGPSRPPLSCPRCGLVLAVRPAWVNPEYCPRCLTFGHTAVKLVARPTAHQYPEHR